MYCDGRRVMCGQRKSNRQLRLALALCYRLATQKANPDPDRLGCAQVQIQTAVDNKLVSDLTQQNLKM